MQTLRRGLETPATCGRQNRVYELRWWRAHEQRRISSATVAMTVTATISGIASELRKDKAQIPGMEEGRKEKTFPFLLNPIHPSIHLFGPPPIITRLLSLRQKEDEGAGWDAVVNVVAAAMTGKQPEPQGLRQSKLSTQGNFFIV